MKIRDRIKRFDRVPANELLPCSRNWRLHSPEQANALRAVLSEIGFASAVLARETEHGLMLCDGHLRAETMGNELVPVLVLDVNEQEADKLLATIDPLAAMAEADKGKLSDLLDSISTGSEALQSMLSQLAEDNGIIPPDFQPTDATARLDEKAAHVCPNCGTEF